MMQRFYVCPADGCDYRHHNSNTTNHHYHYYRTRGDPNHQGEYVRREEVWDVDTDEELQVGRRRSRRQRTRNVTSPSRDVGEDRSSLQIADVNVHQGGGGSSSRVSNDGSSSSQVDIGETSASLVTDVVNLTSHEITREVAALRISNIDRHSTVDDSLL